jgi:hypothetical protein
MRTADQFQLAELQSLLYRLITAPAGVEAASAHEGELDERRLDLLIATRQGLAPRDRLGIYANAYFYRLLDIFKEEFLCTYTVLGDINFHNLITGYLVEYPPAEPSVFYAGRHLAVYIETRNGPVRALIAHVPFLADLARLERACLEVFHGADAEALEPTSLRAFNPESWPFLRLGLHPAAQIFATEWRIEALMTTIKEGRRWEPPERASAAILVWRNQGQVHYRALEPGERAALKTAAGGADFASICASLNNELATAADVTELPVIINRMLTGWLNDGLLIGENI